MLKLAIDLDMTKWSLRDQLDYRTQVGVNPQYALAVIAKAFEGTDEDGSVPIAALNIPVEYIIGMAWVTMRRKHTGWSFDETIDAAGTSDALYEAFVAAMDEASGEPEPEVRPTKAGRAKPAPARTTD